MKAPIELTTIPETFDRLAKVYSGKVAAIYLGSGFTYDRIRHLSNRCAAGLQGLGIGPDSKVVLYLPNSVQWLIAWLGVLKTGAVVSPITPIYTPHDLAYIAQDIQAEAVVCTDRNYGYVRRVLGTTGIKHVIVSNMADMLPGYKRLFGWMFDKVPNGKVKNTPDTIWLKTLLQGAGSTPKPVAKDPGSIAEILFTGGTTKHPKGVPISHELVLHQAHEQISTSAALFPLDENVVLGSAPLFHILGQTTALGTILTHGGTIILHPRVNVDAMLDDVARHKAKTLIGVPALYRMILEHDRLDFYNLESLKYCFSGGDVLPQDVADRWYKKFGSPIYIGYGSTETIGGVSMTPPNMAVPPGAMGKVLDSKEILIVDPAFLKQVPLGDSGELLVHSQPMVTHYWNKPDETKAAFVNIEGKLYYRTADVVRMDEQGWLYFVDRTMDTIKHKGYRVSASEIESVLQDHPAVIASCVVGIPDLKVGERIKAYVVLKSDVKGITGYDLISFCRQKLTAYKVPQYIEFRDMLPKSKVGKLLRREIRAEEKSRLQ
jgi:long-chain acyl-CoA synthetase